MATTIRGKIEAPYQGLKTYEELQDLLDKASVGTGFWGDRYVYAQGVEGTYPLNDLYLRIWRLQKRDQDRDEPILSQEEWEIGTKITTHISHIAKNSSRCSSKTIIFVGILIHARCLFRIIRFESFHPTLLANALIVAGVVSFLSDVKKNSLYSPSWGWGQDCQSGRLFNEEHIEQKEDPRD